MISFSTSVDPNYNTCSSQEPVLPFEILNIISIFADNETYFNLLLTCKDVYDICKNSKKFDIILDGTLPRTDKKIMKNMFKKGRMFKNIKIPSESFYLLEYIPFKCEKMEIYIWKYNYYRNFDRKKFKFTNINCNNLVISVIDFNIDLSNTYINNLFIHKKSVDNVYGFDNISKIIVN